MLQLSSDELFELQAHLDFLKKILSSLFIQILLTIISCWYLHFFMNIWNRAVYLF